MSMSGSLLDRTSVRAMRRLHLSVSLLTAVPLCLNVINWALYYFFSIVQASRLKQQTPTVGKKVVAISVPLFDCSQTHIQTESRGRGWRQSCEHQHQWGSSAHLWMFEQKCIRHWGAQRTIQLCKHAATSFPRLLQACTETSHCLNSTHSIPVPGPQPAAASSLQACLPACLPEQRQIQALHQQGSSTTDKGLL